MKLIPIQGKGNNYLKRPVDSEIIWVDRFKKGFGRKQESLRTVEIMEARDKRDDLFAEWLGEKRKVHKKVKILAGEYWSTWAETKQEKSTAWQDTIKYSGKHLLPCIESLYADEITETWWKNTYIPEKRRSTHKDRRFFNDWKCLTSFLKYLHREGKVEKLPHLINPDSGPEEGLCLDDSEMLSLREYPNEDLQLQIDLGFEHFMRRSEVLLLPFSEIDFKMSVIKLPKERTKIRKKRDVPLNEKVLQKLKARRASQKSAHVFPSPVDEKRSITRTGNDTTWKNAIAKANEGGQRIRPEATFHDLRHSGLTRAFRATNRYAEICVMAGLSLEEAQRTYLHLNPDDTRFVADLVRLK